MEDTFPNRDTPPVSWINVTGLHQVELIEKLGSHFGIHPLVLEDIVNTDQRPKLEEMGDLLFITLKMISRSPGQPVEKTEQVSLVAGPTFVISFQEKEGDVFQPIQERIRDGKGRIRKMASDFLAYALMDAMVDNYFLVLEGIGDEIEEMEDEVLTNPSINSVHRQTVSPNRHIPISGTSTITPSRSSTCSKPCAT